MIAQNFDNLDFDKPLIKAIHTAIKGRARFKVCGLYGNKAIKKYLEFRLSQFKFIIQVNVSDLTGNVLVFFNDNKSLQFISNLIQGIILDYQAKLKTSLNSSNSNYLSAESGNGKFYQSSTILNHNSEQQIFNLANYLSLNNHRLLKQKPLISNQKSHSQARLTNTVNSQTNGKNQTPILDGSNNKIKINSIYIPDSHEISEEKIEKVEQGIALASAAIITLLASTTLIHFYELDRGILLLVKRLHSPIFDRIMLTVTSFGEPLMLLAVCSGFSILTPHYQRHPVIKNLAVAAVGAIGLNYLLKEVFARARPALWSHIVDVGHYSFPSGHAMVSLVIYGFMGYVLAKRYPQYQKQIFAATTILILTIGFSRLYLGVHWATDVIAGYAAGLLWLIACTRSLELGNLELGNLELENLELKNTKA